MTGTLITICVVLTLTTTLAVYLSRRKSTRKLGADGTHEPERDDSGDVMTQIDNSPLPVSGEGSLPDCDNQHVIPRSHHPVSRRDISEHARKVLHRLNNNGFDAYLVGGCIRDLYFDLKPKDFDVATNATPEEVRRLFRNARVIGRRFKLVHVLFGRDVIEVATFRASHDQDEHNQDTHNKDQSHHSHSGRILRDNVYGSIEDDAIRRDFTVNALYYDVRDHSIIDYCGGVEDIKHKTLRLIGDPVKRYHEDPVRMIRALRFVAKLDFQMASQTADPIYDLGHLLGDIPAARLFDEALKLLQSGFGVKTFDLLWDYDLFRYLFPATHHCLLEQDELAEALIVSALKSTDQRIAHQKPVTPAFLFAAMLWPPLQRLAKGLKDQGVPPAPAMQQAAAAVLENQSVHTAIPRRFTMVVRDIWEIQHRLERCQPKSIDNLMAHPKFRAAYDFLVLREKSGEDLGGAARWWTEIQEQGDQSRHTMIRELRTQPGNQRKRRRSRPRKRPSQQKMNGRNSQH